MDTNLRLIARSRAGTGALSDFATSAIEYQHEHTQGPLQASWKLEDGYGQATEAGLRNWFNNRIMWPIVEMYKGITSWSGYIWEMRLSVGNRVYTTTMDGVYNTVLVKYKNDDGDDVYTDWVTDSISVGRYGSREYILDVNTTSADEAEARAAGFLRLSAHPFSGPPQLYNTLEKATLDVTAVGNIALANGIVLRDDKLRSHPGYPAWDGDDQLHYIKATEVNGEPWTVGQEVKRILDVVSYISSDAIGTSDILGAWKQKGWIYPGKVDANDTPTAMGVPSSTGAWDRLQELAKVPNKDGEIYELKVGWDGRVDYEIETQRPAYVAYPSPGRIEKFDRSIPTWDAKPGLIKLLDPSVEPISLPSARYYDKDLVKSDRVTMRDGDEDCQFQTIKDNEIERWAAEDSISDWVASILKEKE